jgi:hypothetical protein
MLPEYQLKGELVISVPRHRHPRATITAGKGWGIWRFTHTSQTCRTRPRTTRHAAPTPESSLRGHRSQNRVGSDVGSATAVKTVWVRTSPHLQRCDRGVDGPGAGDDGPPAAGEGGTCCLRTSCRAS